MFRQRAFTRHRVGDSRLAPVFGGKSEATPIAVRTLGHCRLAPTDLSAKGRLPDAKGRLPIKLNQLT
ncbi:MAG: hypothetical protein LBC02_10500 [Planctomycetaceae bacterium]|nr:hypothetical protein [Planctomycetaceae bacterium]